MSNHLSHILAKWYPNRDNCDWVLATIYEIKGPCYRKPGAMMLFSSQGEQLGMLSGGCLESDIGINARKVMQNGQSTLLCYDGSDEDDLSFHLGIGCGGTVYLMLQQINKENDYLALNQVYDALKQRISGVYYQSVVNKHTQDKTYFEAKKVKNIASTASLVHSPNTEDNNRSADWLATPIVPEPHLLVVGGGIDARPLVKITKQLGWKVSLWDPRPANARREYFPDVDHILKGEADVLTSFANEEGVNAAVLMGHNVSLDAQALSALSETPLQYLALLGPLKRKQQVVIRAELIEENLPFVFAGPSGLDIGGTLPESIALSIIAECHASLYGRKASSISQIL